MCLSIFPNCLFAFYTLNWLFMLFLDLEMFNGVIFGLVSWVSSIKVCYDFFLIKLLFWYWCALSILYLSNYFDLISSFDLDLTGLTLGLNVHSISSTLVFLVWHSSNL